MSDARTVAEGIKDATTIVEKLHVDGYVHFPHYSAFSSKKIVIERIATALTQHADAVRGEERAKVARELEQERAGHDHWAAECGDVKTWLFNEFPETVYDGETALLCVQHIVRRLRSERDEARGERNARARDVADLEAKIAHLGGACDYSGKVRAVHELREKAIEERDALRERIATLERQRDMLSVLATRGDRITDADELCDKCDGRGTYAYASTATWHGGVGGSTVTIDVCNRCWGSGAQNRPWPSWRTRERLEAAARSACERLDTYLRENRGAAAPGDVYRAYRDVFDALAKA